MIDYSTKIEKPESGEFASYFKRYIDLVEDDGYILKYLADNLTELTDFCRAIPEDKHLYRYAPDKWTLFDILQHIIDGERVFAYRALVYARNDQTVLPSFDQDAYADRVEADKRSFNDLLNELETVRKSSIYLFASFNPEDFLLKGKVDSNISSVRALAYQIVGHAKHHINLYNEKYLK